MLEISRAVPGTVNHDCRQSRTTSLDITDRGKPMNMWNQHLKLFVLSLLCLALFSINPVIARAQAVIETPGASTIAVDGGTMRIAHYHYGFIAGYHDVPLDWYWQAV
jgi:hypothetical protein